jgi:two-component system chemotaxis response regulator CheB
VVIQALAGDPGIEVVGEAIDPYMAKDKILELSPDVLTLDVEMPRMDGISFLKILRERRPLPVIVISTLTANGSHAALLALEAGAVDVFVKPSNSAEVAQLAVELPRRVRGAALAKGKAMRAAPASAPSRLTAPRRYWDPRQLILFGASTGGVEALTAILPRLPGDLPPICIVQHIPAFFSKAFAQRLARVCAFDVREAADGDEARPNLALLAPGDRHMTLVHEQGRYRVRLDDSPPVHFTRPAVDRLFDSAAACAGRHTLAVLLTGMGVDGAAGLKRLRTAGARTLAEHESTCVVYGMPRAAVSLGAVNRQAPLDQIAPALLQELDSIASSPTRSANSPASAFASTV